jgi:hypothetical protein
MNEGAFKTKVINRLKEMFPDCEIIKPDPSYIQGHPDLIILWGPYWASLEFKKSANANRQSNQDYYVQRLDGMSFAAFIYPENLEEVLDALEQAFKPPRRTRISKSKPVSLDSLHSD